MIVTNIIKKDVNATMLRFELNIPYFRSSEGINLAVVHLKKDAVIANLWRKWVMSIKARDCDSSNEEVCTCNT